MNTAKSALERHAQTINDRDVDAYRQTMNFPFTYQNYNGIALTIDTADEVGVSARLPWEIIVETDPQWHHTAFDAVEEVAQSTTSAVFKVAFRRIDTAGQASGVYQAIWIATCIGGRWGIQFRHNVGQL